MPRSPESYPPGVRERFAERLRDLRKEKGWTKMRLADEAGLSRPLVVQFEQGQRLPGWHTVCLLADALGCSTDDFR